jgi:hypothetical protein
MVGAGYLLMIASGFDLFYVLAKLYVRGDAAVTAANIKAHEELFLAGFAGALIGVASSLVVVFLTLGRRKNGSPRTILALGSRGRPEPSTAALVRLGAFPAPCDASGDPLARARAGLRGAGFRARPYRRGGCR